jgi:hypothetical protein
MSNDDIAGSAQTNDRVRFDRGRIDVLCEERAGASGVFHASTSAPRSRAANDNQLAWPCLAFADDWYASC